MMTVCDIAVTIQYATMVEDQDGVYLFGGRHTLDDFVVAFNDLWYLRYGMRCREISNLYAGGSAWVSLTAEIQPPKMYGHSAVFITGECTVMVMMWHWLYYVMMIRQAQVNARIWWYNKDIRGQWC